MTTSDSPEEEQSRLRALERYGAIASLRGEEFDGLAYLAAYICRTPSSMVTLVDSTRQWFLSSHGFQATDTSRDVAFCVHALISPDMLIVPDTSADARFASNPLVTGEPFVRFYAGAPLVAPDGYVLGTLCVIDHVARTLETDQAVALQALSRLAMAQLDRHRLKRELHRLRYGE